nr:MAG TPA: hypothetical protein [Caudoviricetes sp.]
MKERLSQQMDSSTILLELLILIVQRIQNQETSG